MIALGWGCEGEKLKELPIGRHGGYHPVTEDRPDLGPQTAVEALVVGTLTHGCILSLCACAVQWKPTTSVQPVVCRCTAGVARLQSMHSSGAHWQGCLGQCLALVQL